MFRGSSDPAFEYHTAELFFMYNANCLSFKFDLFVCLLQTNKLQQSSNFIAVLVYQVRSFIEVIHLSLRTWTPHTRMEAFSPLVTTDTPLSHRTTSHHLTVYSPHH